VIARSSPGPTGRRIRRPVTGRALVLGGVVVLLVVLLASPLHRYLAARSALQQSEQQRTTSQQQLQQLQQQNNQLSDPAYIEQQARIRLQYAMPGDTVYTVVHPGQQSGIDSSAGKSTGQTKVPGDTWNRRLWGSVRAADGSP
jgi:cell division protein FtsB